MTLGFLDLVFQTADCLLLFNVNLQVAIRGEDCKQGLWPAWKTFCCVVLTVTFIVAIQEMVVGEGSKGPNARLLRNNVPTTCHYLPHLLLMHNLSFSLQPS